MRRRNVLRTVPLLLMLVSLTAATAPSSDWSAAGAAYQKGDWKAAAAGYDAITKLEPGSGRAWFRLGISVRVRAVW